MTVLHVDRSVFNNKDVILINYVLHYLFCLISMFGLKGIQNYETI